MYPIVLDAGSRISASEEELAQERGRLLGADAADHLGPVRQPAITQQVVQRTGRAGLVIPRTEHDTADACLRDRTRAHEARFEGHDERAVLQVPGAEGIGCGAEGDDLRMSEGVARELSEVAPFADDGARQVGDDGPHGDVAVRGGLDCQLSRPHHGVDVDLSGGEAHGPSVRPGTLESMRVHVADHPLITHKLTVLRDARTTSPVFRQLTEELVTLLAYEATRGVRVEDVEITTPVTTTIGVRISEPRPIVVPILRAGLGMLDGMVKLLPTAEVGFLGMARNEETFEPTTYAERLPTDLSDRQCFVLDPMLATGGSLGAAIDFLFARGAQDVTAICILGAPEGVAAIEKQVGDRDVTLVLGALDERLNDKGYIVPGLGDAGDRLYGTV